MDARHLGQRIGAASRTTNRRRISGNDGLGGGSLRLCFIFELTQVLQEGEGDHSQQRMMVQADPRTTLEVVESELLLHLLMRLLADPACLDRSSEGLKGGLLRVIGHVVLRLAARASLAHEPHFLAWTMPVTEHLGTITRADANRSEGCLQHAFGAATPLH